MLHLEKSRSHWMIINKHYIFFCFYRLEIDHKFKQFNSYKLNCKVFQIPVLNHLWICTIRFENHKTVFFLYIGKALSNIICFSIYKILTDLYNMLEKQWTRLAKLKQTLLFYLQFLIKICLQCKRLFMIHLMNTTIYIDWWDLRNFSFFRYNFS